jgi:hypothetical protein
MSYPRHIPNDVIASWKLKNIWLNDQDHLQANCGDRGKGKSTAALRDAELHDVTQGGSTRFTPDRIVFLPQDFVSIIKKKTLKKGNHIIWDETGLELSSKRWYTLQNFVVSGIVQTMRFKNLCVIFTYPHFDLVEKSVRRLFQGYLEMQHVNKKRGFARGVFRLFQTNAYTGNIYSKNLRWTDRWNARFYGSTGVRVDIPFKKRFELKKVFYQLPRQELLDAYDVQKKEAVASWYDSYSEQIRLMKKFALESDSTKKQRLKDYFQEVRDALLKGGSGDIFVSPKTGRVDSGKVQMEFEGLDKIQAGKISRMLNDEIDAGILVLEDKSKGVVPKEKKEKLSLDRDTKEYLKKKYGRVPEPPE